MQTVRIVGAGRAGRSFETALSSAGIEAQLWSARSDPELLFSAAHGVDVVIVTVCDRHVHKVAVAIEPDPSTVVLHCSGALGLDVLAPHLRRGSLHPLATLPDPVIGALRLQGGTYFAVEGDHMATEVALALGGRPIAVRSGKRVDYHAAACIASNHLVALMGQVQRVAETAGLPLEAFLPLARGALDDVALLGPAAALTGPAVRRDRATIEAHRAALDEEELPGYDAGVALAERLGDEGAALTSRGGTRGWS